MGRARIAIPPGGFRDIAVLRLSSLGDVVLTLPVVHALRAAYPDAKLHFWVKEEYADLVRHDPAIDHVRVLEKDARRVEDLVSMGAELESCDLIVDLHGSARSRLLTWRQKAPVLRVASQRFLRERWVRARWTRPRPADHATARYAATLSAIPLSVVGEPRVSAGAAAEAWAEEHLAGWGSGPAPVALCPGAKHATKRWPEARWCELDEALSRAGERRLVFTTAAERRALPALAARIESDPAARWCVEPLPRMAALLSRCAVAVTHDSGLMHLAAARGTRVVALFGSTSPALGFAPSGTGHVVLCRNEPCQPCTLHGRESCPKRHFRCMTGIEVGHVLDALASARPVRLSPAEPVA